MSFCFLKLVISRQNFIAFCTTNFDNQNDAINQTRQNSCINKRTHRWCVEQNIIVRIAGIVYQFGICARRKQVSRVGNIRFSIQEVKVRNTCCYHRISKCKRMRHYRIRTVSSMYSQRRSCASATHIRFYQQHAITCTSNRFC